MSDLFKQPARRAGGGRAVLVLVLMLVNGAAIWGQVGWALSHIVPEIVPAGADWRLGLALALGFAAALELTGVCLALFADEADEVGVPSGGMRFGSYAMGLVSGAINLSHWGWGAAGIAFALLSAISPFLWGIRAKIRRGRPVAPSRRFWHPRKSVTLIREMAWRGLADEDDALRRLAAEQNPDPAPVVEAVEQLAPAGEPIRAEASIELPDVEDIPVADRRGTDALVLALAMLKDGGKPGEVAEKVGLSAPTVRRYAAMIRTLRADPAAEIDSRKLSVRQWAVSDVREWAKRENAQWP